MLRDILRGEDPQIAAILGVIAHIDPDVVLLTDIDWDLGGAALAAFNAAGPAYPYVFTAQPNSGRPSGHDLDRNGRLGEARDAWGYGRFSGDGGMAVLSRVPIGDVTDLSMTPWQTIPEAKLPLAEDGTAFFNASIAATLPVSSTGHWVVPILAEGGTFDLLAWSATPPVFDGPEDANGLRNRDELLIWRSRLDDGPFVLIGNANLDPVDGDGFTDAMATFLQDPRLSDPRPNSLGGAQAADPGHSGPQAMDTADWPDGQPGNLRVSYVLPSADWQIIDAGVFWPALDDPAAALLGDDGLGAGVHKLVWVDIAR